MDRAPTLQGVLTALLKAASSCSADRCNPCSEMIETVASVGIMYLSTAVGALPA